MTTMLNIANLNVNYDNIQAIRNVSIHIDEGEIVTLIGANGAGKSTIMRTVMGLKKANGGQITYLGTDITNQLPQKTVIGGITLVPEGRQVFPDLNVKENLELGGYIRNKQEKREAMEMVCELFPRLRERERQTAGTFSGGEQQMLVVARALMSKPKLLLMDEPSLGLAPLLVKEVFDLIARIRKLGTTILLVEQNARMALKVSDRAYVLETGQIVLEGRSEEMLYSEEVKRAYLGGL